MNWKLFVGLAPFFFSVFFIFPAARAQNQASVNREKLAVYAEPNPASEVLVTLKKGSVVTILERRGAWAKVRVTLKGGFKFEGWTDGRQLSSGAVVVPPTPVPSVQKESDTTFWNDRIRLSAAAEFVSYGYKVSTGGASPGTVFSYTLMGPGLRGDAEGWFMEWKDRKLRLGASARFEYAKLDTTTDLQDTTGSTFQTQDSGNSLQDFGGGLTVEYRWGLDRNAAKVGASVGVDYNSFNAEDVQGKTGPINLYVSQTTTSILFGFSGAYPIAERFILNGGVDLLLLNWVSESPADATGTDPGGSFGFVPSLDIAWLATPRHWIGLGYQMRYQNFSFSGTGSRLNTANVTDGSARVWTNVLLARYRFVF